MSSDYTYPENSIYWRLRYSSTDNGSGQIGIVVDSDDDGELDAIDETQTAGILIDYITKRTQLNATSATIMATEPDLPSTLHTALIDFVVAKLFLQRASNVNGENRYVDINTSKMFMSEYYRKMQANRSGKPKTGTMIMPPKLGLR